MVLQEDNTSALADDLEVTGSKDDTVILSPLDALRHDVTVLHDDELRELALRRGQDMRTAEKSIQVIIREIQRRETEATDLDIQRLLKNPMCLQDLLRDPDRKNDASLKVADEVLERLTHPTTTDPYDAFLLHDESIEPERTLLRKENFVLVEYDGTDTFTLHIPKGSDESGAVRIVKLQFPGSEECSAFAELLGYEIRVDSDLGKQSLGESVDRGDGLGSFTAAVPLALQVVNIGGRKQYRLPDVVLEDELLKNHVLIDIDK